MRTSIEIPDALYREIKLRAAHEGTTLREAFLEGATLWLRKGSAGQQKRRRFPAVESKNPGSLSLGEEGVYEYIPFP
jgi:hypothetical protein